MNIGVASLLIVVSLFPYAPAPGPGRQITVAAAAGLTFVFKGAIHQAAVILKSSRNKDAVRQFLDFPRRPGIASLMRSYGFALPGARAAGATP